jgi:tight adherence protein C
VTIVVIVGILFGAGIVLYGALTVKQLEDTLSARINRFDLKPAGSLTELELQIPRAERLFGPPRRFVAQKVRQFTPVGTIEKTQTKLMQAGNPRNLTVQDFLGIKGMVALGLGVLALLVFFFLFHVSFIKFLGFTAGAVFAGFNLPDYWIRQKIKERQKEIQRYLADAIDVLAISVEAGQGFDGALETLSRRKQNALTQEFDRFRLEVQAGKGRREAFRDLALRTGVEDLNAFVAAMIQADQLGIGIAHVLRTQSIELRIKRRQRAEERARQAPIKMLFPLILLMFPSLFMVILGPSIPRLLTIVHGGV